MPEVMIPSWVRPENPERIALLDDGTQMFQPQFARGTTQTQIWADPRWQFTRRYRGMRSDEKALLLTALNDARGKGVTIRLMPHASLRGSFPATELLSNNTFGSGSTGWTAGTDWSISVSDRVLRASRTAVTTAGPIVQASSAVTLVQYAPYTLRYMLRQGRGSFTTGHQPTYVGIDNFGSNSTGFGLLSAGNVRTETSVTPGVRSNDTSGMLAGDFFDLLYLSLSRCALVDNGQNLFTRSTDVSHADWSKTSVTVSTQGGPDGGAATAFQLVETAVNSGHYVSQDRAVSASGFDYCVATIAVRNTRDYLLLVLEEATGGHQARAWFNINTGVLGTVTTTGANMANVRAVIQSKGNGFYYCALVARKTNATTTIQARVGAASADASPTYLGVASQNAISVYQPTFAQSSVPVRVSATTSSVLSTGTAQTGGSLHLKGLPASTSGLLLPNDWASFNGELKQTTTTLSSDAAGLGYWQFRPAIGESPADNDPVEILEPWGRFRLMNGAEYDNMWGTYTDAELEFSEVYE